jgi:hypothetical protein
MKNTLKPLPSFEVDTPRTDEVRHNVAELVRHSRKLERELAEILSSGISNRTMNHNTSAQCHTENGEVFMTDQSGNGHHLKRNKMKKLSDTLTELGIAFGFPIIIEDANGNETYYEDSNGNCVKWEFDANGDFDYYEDSTGVKKGTPRSAKTCEGKVVEVDGIKYELKAL